MTSPSLAFTRRRAHLASYSTWQFRDFAINIAILTLILFGLIGWVYISQLNMQEAMAVGMRTRRGLPIEFPLSAKLSQFLNVYGMYSIVAALVAVTGIASQDRAQGYTRFLFSKPLSIRAYYAQSLLVRWIGFLVLGQVLVLAYGHFQPPSYTPRFLVEMSLSFLSVAGIVFLLSAVTRYDGLIAIVFFLVSTLVRSHWETKTGIGHGLTYLFPPIDQSDQVRRWVVRLDAMGVVSNPGFPWKVALWNGGYGLACLLVGLYLLRRIPLTKA